MDDLARDYRVEDWAKRGLVTKEQREQFPGIISKGLIGTYYSLTTMHEKCLINNLKHKSREMCIQEHS